MANTKVLNALCAEAEGIAAAYKAEQERDAAGIASALEKQREAENKAAAEAAAGNYAEYQQAEQDRAFWSTRVAALRRKNAAPMFPDRAACVDLAVRVEKAAHEERAELTREMLAHLAKAAEIAEAGRRRESEMYTRLYYSVGEHAKREHGRGGFAPIISPAYYREVLELVDKLRASIDQP